MTGITRTSAGLDSRRKRLLFQAWHRGMREMDLLLGRFADSKIESMTGSELDRFEALMGWPDPEVFAWICGDAPIPDEVDAVLVRRIADFQKEFGASA